ncbi:MAG: flavodoxin, partial [Paludibacteraceae bacterium]|nr:flavodoxin [Paludibacteraceae bacterium]
YNTAKAGGANIVGAVDASDYTFDDSEAVIEDQFVGLALDNDNEEYKTAERIDKWIAAISPAL